VCAACGGPRLPAKEPFASSERAVRELRVAERARKMGFTWRLAAIGLSLAGTFIAALGAALAMVSVPVSLVLIAVAVALFVFGVLGSRRAKDAREQAKRSVFGAWESFAEAFLRTHGGEMTAKEAAEALKTTEEDVERIMSFLSVDDRANVEVKDAEIVYSARVPMRVDTGTEVPLEEPPQEPEEEEEHGSAERASSADQRRG
jgi:hypothetical protein